MIINHFPVSDIKSIVDIMQCKNRQSDV